MYFKTVGTGSICTAFMGHPFKNYKNIIYISKTENMLKVDIPSV